MVYVGNAEESVLKNQWEEDLRKVFSLSAEEEAALDNFFLMLSGYERTTVE